MKRSVIHFEIVERIGDERRVRIACDKKKLKPPHILSTSIPGNVTCKRKACSAAKPTLRSNEREHSERQQSVGLDI